MSAVAAVPRPEAVRVYVWDLVVRATHWLIALSIVVLSVTGFYIGHPFWTVTGEARMHFVMGTVRAVHLYTAVVFTLAVATRIAWMFVGPEVARWHQFLPVPKERRRKLGPTLSFYLFIRRDPPFVVGHNPLAGAFYVLVFGLYLVQVVTGLALFSMQAGTASPAHLFGAFLPLFGGPQVARWIHHVVMWLLLGFAVHHVYSGVLVSMVEKNATIESIVSGWKFFRRSDLEASQREAGK